MKISDFNKNELIGKSVLLVKETYGDQVSYFQILSIKKAEAGKNIILHGNWMYQHDDGFDMQLDIDNEMYPSDEVKIVSCECVEKAFQHSAKVASKLFLNLYE